MAVLYEFRCPECGGTREFWRAAADRDWLPACACDPRCLGTLMHRVVTAPAIRGETVSKA
jgi:putative FmdB family regulatory protein